MRESIFIRILRFLVILLFLSQAAIVDAQCSSVTPTFTLDLSGNPSGSSVTPLAARNGTCCGGSIPCVKIVVILNPNAMALQLTPTGADPGGALTYEFNCNGQQIPGGTPVCLSGTGPQTLTICKVGNNANSYSVTSIPKPTVQDTLIVRGGCTTTLYATGYSVPTITWTAINGGTNTSLYNSYLSCTSGCSSVVVAPSGTVPVPYIDYVVSGFGQAPCQAAYYSDTARVFFYTDLSAAISPTTICFGSTSAVLNPTTTGGKSPYTYTWSTGSNSSSVTVGAGTYTLTLGDQTGCPPVTATVTVGNFTLPITADAGANILRCKSDPNVPLSGTITSASGGTWSAGGGSFNPSNSALTTTYMPTAGEVSSGSVQIILGTTGNSGCPPDEDTIIVSFQNQPTITATPDQTLCANNNISLHSAIVSGYSATATWSATGGGTLTPPVGLITNYHPTPAQVNSGSTQVVAYTTNNGACPGDSDTINVYFTASPTVAAGAASQNICSNGAASLNGSVSPAAFSGSWSTTGDGSFSNPGSLVSSYVPGTSDIATGTVALVLHATNLGNCNPVTDTILVTISRIATVTISSPTLICSSFTNIGFSSTVTGGAGTATWSSSGTGSFNSISISQPQYFLSAADQTLSSLSFSLTSTGNGPCPQVVSSVNLSVAPMPTVNAGSNFNICASPGTIGLATGQPTITGSSTTGTWSVNGIGSLTQGADFLQAGYSVTAQDITNGSVIFTLTSTNNGICPPAADTVMIRVVSLPVLNAGPSQTICTTAGSIALSGTVTGGTLPNGVWVTSGAGPFAPSNTVLTTQYSLTPADLSAGSLLFTLISANPGPCPVQTNTTLVTIVQMATVLPGPNAAICSSQPSIALNGTVLSTASTGTWLAGGSGNISPTGSASAVYFTTSADISAGNVTFTLTSTGNGPCAAVSNTMTVPIILQPTVAIAVTPSLCSSSATAAVAATVTGGSGTGNWTSAGSGTFVPVSTSLNGSYIAGNSDLTNNGVVLTFVSTNQAPCAAASYTAFVQIQDPPTATAAANQVICSNQGSIALTGTILGTFNTGTWSASGTGSVNPPNAVNSTYQISPADIAAGTVNFTLTSTNNGACPAATATAQAQIIRPATVTASPAQSVCSTSTITAVSGTISGGSGNGIWSTSGSGAFTPGNTALNTSYQFTAGDVSNGSVLLILASANTSPCPTSSDSVIVSFQIPPQVDPGPPQLICSIQSTIALSGTVTNTFNSGKWSSAGLGAITPSNNQVATYSVTAGDIATGSVIFTLTSTNDGACPSATGILTVQISREATITATPAQTLCSTSNSAVIGGTVSGGSGSVLWSTNGTGQFQPAGTLIATSYSFGTADINAGSVLLTLSAVNNSPCPLASDTVRIYVQSPSLANTGTYQTVCSSDGVIQLAGQVSGGKQTGEWSSLTGGVFLPSGSDLSASYSITPNDILFGAASLTLSSTNNGACPASTQTISIPITQHATVVAMPSFSICSNQQVTALTGTVTGNVTTVAWSASGQGSLVATGPSRADYSLAQGDISQGSVTFILTAAPNGPCPAASDTTQMNITLRPVIQLTSDTSVCSSHGLITMNGQIADGSGEVLWVSSGTGSFIPGNYQLNSTYIFSEQDIKNGKVHLSLNSMNNAACGNVSSTMTLDILPSPVAEFTASTYSLTLPAEPLIFTNNTVGGSTYSWTVSDGTSANTIDLTRSFSTVGYYTVTLIAENEHQCLDSVSKLVTVISTVKFPNAFSPNGDKLNDVFRPYTDGVIEYDLMIFNRWGELIFKSANINLGWDGTFNGKTCQQDAYAWKVKMVFFDGREFEGTGTVTLLR